MAKRYHMTWYASSRRWRKCVGGKWYSVSCKQLGMPESKEASWKAANDWWERERHLLDIPTEDDRRLKATMVGRLVEDFSKLDDEARRQAVEALLGVGSYNSLKARAGAMLMGMDTPTPERTVRHQINVWQTLLRGVCRSGQMSEGRLDAYCRNIRIFAEWVGQENAIDEIDETKLEGFFNHLTDKISHGDYSPSYAHMLLMTAKQFISRLAEMKLIPLPGNIRSRRFRFNHSVPTNIDIFTPDEIRSMLTACDGYSERTKLYVLLMLNCGMYQNDIAELRQVEVDWQAGTITRPRSKTRERGGPTVCYKLWPETFALLRKHRSPGELAITTADGNPLVKYWLEGTAYRRYDSIQSAWNRLAVKMGMRKHRLGLKHLRKTSASLLGEHPHYKFYGNHFLADSPRGMAARHCMIPSDEEFFQALDWLRLRVLPEIG